MEYRIGEFSTITRLSAKTLRFYQDEGLIEPENVDRYTGYRLYNEKLIERAILIRELRAVDFSLKEIHEILATCGDDSELLPHIERKRAEIAQRLREYRAIDNRLVACIRAEKERRTMDTQQIRDGIELTTIEDIIIVSKRYKGTYTDVGKHIGGLFRAAGRWSSGPVFSLYWDGEYREEGADIELCLPVKKMFALRDQDTAAGFGIRVLAGGRFIRGLHRGAYEHFGDTYRLMIDALKDKGLEMAVPTREHYLKGPGMLFKGNPKAYLTEIELPILR